MYEYRARCLRVIDGDTLDLDIDLGLFVHAHERVRLARIDAWEVRGTEREKGLEAALFVRRLVGPYEEPALTPNLIVRTIKDQRGKYGRFLAEIVLPDGQHLNDLLVSEGHAEYREY